MAAQGDWQGEPTLEVLPPNMPQAAATGPGQQCHLTTLEHNKEATNSKNLALMSQALTGNLIMTSSDLINFLTWQSGCQADGEEEKKFREDALLCPKLLVFTAMQKNPHLSI